MVIRVVGWGSVRDGWCGDWQGGGASSLNDSIDVLHDGKYLGAGVAGSGVVDGFPVAVDPDIGLPLIDLSEGCCSLSLCLPPVLVILIELLRNVDSRSSWLPPPWDGKSILGSPKWELWLALGEWGIVS